MYDLFIKNGLVYIDGSFKNTNIGVKDSKIAYLGPIEFPSKEIVDAKNRKIIPGLIDPHVHFDLFCGTIPSRDDFYYGSNSFAFLLGSKKSTIVVTPPNAADFEP